MSRLQTFEEAASGEPLEPGIYELELKPARDPMEFIPDQVEAWVRLTLPYEWRLIRWHVRGGVVMVTAELSAPTRD